jgi:hypothetical protein
MLKGALNSCDDGIFPHEPNILLKFNQIIQYCIHRKYKTDQKRDKVT